MNLTMMLSSGLAFFALTQPVHGAVIDQEGYDISLLGAGFTSRVVTIGASADSVDHIAVATCQEASRHPRYSHGVVVYDEVGFDCTEQVRRLLNEPLLAAVTVTAYMEPGTLNSLDPGPAFSGQVVEF